jgi:TonB family protein
MRSMRSKRSKQWAALAASVLLQMPPAALAADQAEDLAVVHAEVPEYPRMALKARLTGTVTIRVTIDPAGKVTSTAVEQGLPMGLSQHAEAAARNWIFKPSDPSDPSDRRDAREAVLSFVFAEAVYSEAPDHVEASFDDPLTVRLVYSMSTVAWLPRVNGEIPEKRCPIHDQIMAVELVPVRPEGCRVVGAVAEETPELRRWREEHEAYADAREKLFPEVNHWAKGSVGASGKAEVYYCQLCRDIESLWLARHPGFTP